MPRKTKKQTGRSEWMKKYNATRGNKEQKRLEVRLKNFKFNIFILGRTRGRDEK